MKKKKIKMFLIAFLSLIFLQNSVYAHGKSYNSGKEVELEEIETDKEETKKNEEKAEEKQKEEQKDEKKEKSKNTNSKATIKENVSSENKVYNGDKRHENRQFLTFTTKNGKEYHLIIDYTQNSEQVKFLSEISEAELLDIIKSSKDSNGIKDSTLDDNKAKEDIGKMQKELVSEIKDLKKVDKNNKNTMNSNGLISYIPYVIVAGVIVYYFYKKKKRNSTEKDEIEEDKTEEEIEEDDDEI